MLTTTDLPSFSPALLADLERRSHRLVAEAYGYLLEFDAVPPLDLFAFVEEALRDLTEEWAEGAVVPPAIVVVDEIVGNLEEYLGDPRLQ